MSEQTTDDDLEVTLDMISVGVEAYNQFNPEQEDPEALVFVIIYRAFEIAKRNRETLQQSESQRSKNQRPLGECVSDG